MQRSTREYRYDFRGHQGFPVVGSGVGAPFTIADTSAAGAPTFGALAGGGYQLLPSATNEVQNLCLYQGDALSFDIDDIIRAWFIIKSSVASPNAATSFAWGLASARADDPDAIAAHAMFRCIGSSAILCESDDGTTDKDDVATGLTIGTSWKKFEVNFAERNTSMEPPSVSLGRKSNVGFYGSNDNQSLRRVASGTRFDMSAYSAGLQFFFQNQKTAATSIDALHILECGIEVNLPIGW